MLRSCQSVREGFSASIDTNPAAAGFTLTIIYLQMSLLTQLACTKTFKDTEYELISQKSRVLCEFLKHLCVDNCQKNKKMMGEFSPTVPGLPYVNKAKKPLFYEIYVRTETQLGGYNIWSNTSNHLLISDRPEYLEYLMNFLQVITECCTGPCNKNQKQIYIYRSDMYIGMIRRVIYFVDSSYYPIKNQIIDYIGSLIEGDDKQIVNHFASNLTFDELFKLICSTVKRLFMYFCMKKDASLHQKLIREIMAARMKAQDQLALEENQLRSARIKDLEFYLDVIKETESPEATGLSIGQMNTIAKNNAMIFDDPRVITDEMMALFKVEKYEDVLNLYLKDCEFSGHVLLVIAMKLNEFLNKFINYVPGYRFSLEKIYTKMAISYKDQVPAYILGRISNKSTHLNAEYDENIALYMFMCKITEEVKFKSPKHPEKVRILYPVVPEFYDSVINQSSSNQSNPDEDWKGPQDICENLKKDNRNFDYYCRLATFLAAQNPNDRNVFEEYLVKHHESRKANWLLDLKEDEARRLEDAAFFQTDSLEFQKEAKDKFASLLEKIGKLEDKVTDLTSKVDALKKE